MATKTTTAVGNYNAGATWIGGVAPVAGDRIILNHAVSVTANADIGDSPSDTTTDVVTVNGVTLTIKAGVTFRLRGNMALVDAPLVIGEVTGGGVFIFDATLATDPTTQYICKVGTLNFHTNAKVTTRGVVGTRSSVKSEVGSGNGYFGSGVSAAENDRLGTGWYDLADTDFLRIGNATKSGWYVRPLDNGLSYTINRCDFKSCGDITFGSVPASISITLDHVTQRGSLGSFGLKVGGTVATPVTGNRWLKFSVFDKAITWSAASLIEDSILQDFFSDAAGNGRFSSFARNFARLHSNATSYEWLGGDHSECYLVADGSTYNPLTGFYTAIADIVNPHWFTCDFGPTGRYQILDSIIESWGSDGVGDIARSEVTGYDLWTKRVLVLPDQQTDVAPNNAIIIDDNDGSGITYTGTWSRYAPFEMHYADPQANTNNALMTFTPGAGTYNVKFSWPAAASDGTRASAAKLEIYDNTTLLDTKFYDQTVAPNDFSETGRDYENVGNYTIASATLKVKLYADAVKYVLLDAVRIVSTAINPPVHRNSGTLGTEDGWNGQSNEYEYNTQYGGGQGMLALAEAGNGYLHMVAKFKNNLGWNDVAFSAAGFNFLAYPPTHPVGIVTDIIDPAQCDYNGTWGVRTNGLHGPYDIPLSATVGAHDVNGNPGFLDSTRDFTKWVISIAGATLPGNPTPTRTDYNAYGLTQLSKLNDADFNPAYTLAALKTYIRNGFRPSAPGYITGSSDGTTIGAVQASMSITPAPSVVRCSNLNPGVRLGPIQRTPAPSVVRCNNLNPTIRLGAIPITPAPSVVRCANTNPFIPLSGIRVTPAPSIVRCFNSNPFIPANGIVVTPAPSIIRTFNTNPILRLGGIAIHCSPSSVRCLNSNPITDSGQGQLDAFLDLLPSLQGRVRLRS